MRFKIGKTEAQHWESIKEEFPALNVWTPWFAWHPVRVDDNRWAWLEVVERRIEIIDLVLGRFWTYRMVAA